VFQHIAEWTSVKTLPLRCQFVSDGLVLFDRVEDTGLANGEQIRQWNEQGVLQLPWFHSWATLSSCQVWCMNCRFYFSLCCRLLIYTGTLKVPINYNKLCFEFGYWETWPGKYNVPQADRIMHCKTYFAFQLSPLTRTRSPCLAQNNELTHPATLLHRTAYWVTRCISMG
jgi:hypothetical protein